MRPKRRSLGRGLEALLGADPIAPEPVTQDGLRELPIDLLERGRYQPRVDMRQESLQERPTPSASRAWYSQSSCVP